MKLRNLALSTVFVFYLTDKTKRSRSASATVFEFLEKEK